MKSRISPLLLVGALLVLFPLVSPEAIAKVKRSSLFPIWLGRSAIATDASGRPHIAFQTPNHRLKHAWLDGKRWKRKAVDTISDSGWDNSIAVDSQGRVHIAYHAERSNPSRQVLAYAVIDSSGPQITDIDDGGYATAIVIDSNDRPQILYYGSGGFALKLAKSGASGWAIEDTGLSGLYFFPTSLALDSSGAAHVSFTERLGDDIATYATNASGSWQATALAAQPGGHVTTSLALDSQDRPRVAVTIEDTVRYFTFDGATWQSEDVFEAPDVTQYPDFVALALDSADRPYVLFSTSVSVGEGGVEGTLYGFNDGTGWRVDILDRRNSGFEVAIALDGGNTVHGTYRKGQGETRSTLKYARITIPTSAVSDQP